MWEGAWGYVKATKGLGATMALKRGTRGCGRGLGGDAGVWEGAWGNAKAQEGARGRCGGLGEGWEGTRG